MGERGHCISVRMSETEVAELDRRRGKIRRGTFLRKLFLGKREPRQIPEPNQRAYQETARWASNLNQIAVRLNGADSVAIEEIRRTLAGFRAGLIGLAGDDE